MPNNETLELYKLHSQLANEITKHRNTANAFYTSLTSGTIFIFLSQIEKINSHIPFTIIVNGLGILISIIWIISINYYRKLNKVKFSLLGKLEKKLSFQFFEEEWIQIKSRKRNWFELTRIERLLPVLYIIAFLIITNYYIFK